MKFCEKEAGLEHEKCWRNKILEIGDSRECRVIDERPTGNKTQLVSRTTVEKQVIKIILANLSFSGYKPGKFYLCANT